MYVRAATARDAKRMWCASCFLLKHGGGTLGNKYQVTSLELTTIIIKKQTISHHGPLSASHSSLMYFSFLDERSGRRRPPAERSALYTILLFQREKYPRACEHATSNITTTTTTLIIKHSLRDFLHFAV